MNETQPRKIIKVKKRVTIAAQGDHEVLRDEETGEVIEFEGDVEGENEEFIDEQEVVQNPDSDEDADWQDEDAESDEEVETA